MRMLYLAVKNRDAESTRRILNDRGYINADVLIEKEGRKVLLPLIWEDKSLVEQGVADLGELTVREGRTKFRPPRSYKDVVDVPRELKDLLPSSFDIIGDVCILKLPDGLADYGDDIAQALTLVNKNIKHVALDRGVIGEYRLRDMEVLLGGPDLETVHIENNIRLKLDPSKVYFSPRLSTERQRIASLTQDERVLDMFCGVGPFALTIARHGRAREIVGIDLNPECIRYMEMNISLNSLEDRVSCYLGDSRDVAPTLGPFDRVVMNLPHSSLDFLEIALNCIERGRIHLYIISETAGVQDTLRMIDDTMINNDRVYSLEGVREVHQYSPDSYMVSLDLHVH
ncbi:MAG: class I SAM-dependent methyltransferase family protein [Candidatus Thermoplasmatota archaeon]|nr:class I SAM-dependent methyltransferase family protein [Candidatus Thermoplasmatota archaeon]